MSLTSRYVDCLILYNCFVGGRADRNYAIPKNQPAPPPENSSSPETRKGSHSPWQRANDFLSGALLKREDCALPCKCSDFRISIGAFCKKFHIRAANFPFNGILPTLTRQSVGKLTDIPVPIKRTPATFPPAPFSFEWGVGGTGRSLYFSRYFLLYDLFSYVPNDG